MKKKLLFMSLFVSLLTACTNNEIIEKNDDGQIGFGAFVGKSTKATPVNIDGLKSAGFWVLASNTGNDDWTTGGATSTPGLIYNKQVTFASNVWSYSPIISWPGTDKVTFFAYSPQTGVTLSATDAAGTPTITFVNPDANASQVDLVADMVKDQTRSTNSNKVSFAFKHLLSKVGFKAKVATTYSGVSDISITACKIIYASNSVMSSRKYTFSTDNSVAGIWTDLASPVYHPNGAGDGVLGSTPIALTNDGTAAAVQVNDADKYVMLIPQTLTAGNLKVAVTFKYTTTSDSQEHTNTITVDLPATTLLPGKQYTYNLSLALNLIQFESITISDWVDGTTPAETVVQ